MPREIKSSDQFQKLIPTAQEIRVVRSPEAVKLKLRTPELLYTYKTSSSEADDILKGVKDIEVIELTPVSKSEQEGKKKSEGSSEEAATTGETSPQAEEEKKKAQPPKPRSAKKRKS